jgi:hypothetical protein
MFQFDPDEKIIDYTGPLDNHTLTNCSECPQVAFRVLYLKSEREERHVALCGSHFTEACTRYPEIRRIAGLRIAI